jgi:hypothetical protein
MILLKKCAGRTHQEKLQFQQVDTVPPKHQPGPNQLSNYQTSLWSFEAKHFWD